MPKDKVQFDIFRGASLLRDVKKWRKSEKIDVISAERMKKTAEEGALAEGLNLSQARDILWGFKGCDLYRMVAIEQRWSSQEYETWFAELLIKKFT